MTVFGVVLTMVGLAMFWAMMDGAYRIGHSKGYAKGMDEAAGWRDKAIADLRGMVVEALRQRDEARACAWTPPNPFARKDLN